MQRSNKKSYFFWFVGIFSTFIIIHLYYSTVLPITGDEAYHWEWSRHLDLGYYDHPPMVGWVIAFSRWIGSLIGGSELFWTRLPAVLSISGLILLTYKMVVQITGKRKLGLYSLLLLGVTPLFSLGSIIITTDQPLIFFWALTLYFLYQALFRERVNCWYYAGCAMGLAFLSKFLSILILPGIIFFLLLSSEDRFWLKRKEPYLFLIIAGLIYLPNLYWNITHDWATFLFNLSSRHDAVFSFKNMLVSLSGQMLVIGPVLFLALVAGIFRAGKQILRKNDRISFFFFSISISVFGFMGLLSFFRRVGAHWPAIGYMSVVITFIYVYRKSIFHNNYRKAIWWILHAGLIISLILAIALHLLPLYAYLLPDKITVVGKDMQINHSDLGALYGWEKLGKHVDKIQQMTEEEVFFITPSYSFSSLVSFNAPSHPFVRLFDLGGVYGQNYKYWNNFAELKGKDAVFTYTKPVQRYQQKLEASFEKVEEMKPLKIYDPRGRHVSTIYFTYCKEYLGTED